MEAQNNHPILKDLNAALTYATEHFKNEFQWQEIRLKDSFKNAFTCCLAKKDGKVEFFTNTTIVTTKKGQQIFIANQWFAIASYYVDFCTELLTYRQYFEKICKKLSIFDKNAMLQYATKMKTCASQIEKQQFFNAAYEILHQEFSNHPDCNKVANYLVKFVTDYKWWSGSKTVDRHDFYISPVLNQMNVVNASSEFLAEIVHCYASDYNLRKMVEDLDSFVISAQKKKYTPTAKEEESFNEAESISIPSPTLKPHVISISAASLERFQSGK